MREDRKSLYKYQIILIYGTKRLKGTVLPSVADPDRFGPDPDPTSENKPDPVPDPDSSK